MQAEVAGRIGVSQPQVARIEKQGYDSYPLTNLCRYVRALGHAFQFDIVVWQVECQPEAPPVRDDKTITPAPAASPSSS